METGKTKSKKPAVAKTDATAQPEPATTAAPTATTAPASGVRVEQRENPRINEKIDEWIKQFPDGWNYFMSLPPERMARKLVLNEINKYERQQKAKSYRQEEQRGGETAPRFDRSQSNGNGMRAR